MEEKMIAEMFKDGKKVNVVFSFVQQGSKCKVCCKILQNIKFLRKNEGEFKRATLTVLEGDPIGIKTIFSQITLVLQKEIDAFINSSRITKVIEIEGGDF